VSTAVVRELEEKLLLAVRPGGSAAGETDRGQRSTFSLLFMFMNVIMHYICKNVF
jgi:hypothetical protein